MTVTDTREELAQDAATPVEGTADPQARYPDGRAGAAAALACIAASIVVGGVFLGAGARVVAALAALAGVAVAAGASRLQGALASNLALVAGIGVTGLLALALGGVGDLTHLAALVRTAVHVGSLLRPPVSFLAGWHAIIGWLMATVGVVAGWVAFVIRKPTVAVLLPVPLAVIAGISVPSYAQAGTGIAAVALFAGALGLVATGQLVGDDATARPPLGFQLRRAARSIVVIGVMIVVLVAAARADFLFPKPAVNPQNQPQLPHVVPPTNAPNRVLFTVRSASLGPYRVGDLDVYDGAAWRFAPVADSELKPVPASGIVNPAVHPGVTATITMRGYSGNVLPTLANLNGIIASGPQLSYDARSDTIRLAQGAVSPGLSYVVAAGALPSIAALKRDVAPDPPSVVRFTSAPVPPGKVEQLLVRLKQADPWDTFVALRDYVLKTVVAKGPGVPIAVPPSRVAAMLFGRSHTASPFEVTAATALLARWAGIPARVGFGFEATAKDMVQGAYQITPADADSYPEVYFPHYGWLPVIGTPEHAQASEKNSASKSNPSVKPSSSLAVQIAVPVETPPPSILAAVTLIVLGSLAGLAASGWAVYVLLPLLRKRRRRHRLRAAAAARGPQARLALAYAEWRDAATDFGYRDDGASPLGFLARFGEDEEHAELAWLVTRALWGDLRGSVSDAMAGTAEELSRALRRRLAQAHPFTLRVIAALSRQSLRHPYAPGLEAAFSDQQPALRREEETEDAITRA